VNFIILNDTCNSHIEGVTASQVSSNKPPHPTVYLARAEFVAYNADQSSEYGRQDGADNAHPDGGGCHSGDGSVAAPIQAVRTSGEAARAAPAVGPLACAHLKQKSFITKVFILVFCFDLCCVLFCSRRMDTVVQEVQEKSY